MDAGRLVGLRTERAASLAATPRGGRPVGACGCLPTTRRRSNHSGLCGDGRLFTGCQPGCIGSLRFCPETPSLVACHAVAGTGEWASPQPGVGSTSHLVRGATGSVRWTSGLHRRRNAGRCRPALGHPLHGPATCSAVGCMDANHPATGCVPLISNGLREYRLLCRLLWVYGSDSG
ncbi:hypothetical protein SAMN04490185_4353 [Pseudomonas frederiksbergensis]|uniref:Uncharacterized protein n=1 Tax=Pseudomonas frederiksbergensis TaxID=104087 RepID=A0A1H5E2Y2_9PSED|nr:hypothetical protein SAMN04490185_4353 [Pseudomonas frederiksbergensis]